MQIKRLHGWNVKPKEAVQIQLKMASRVDARAPLTRIELVAGADIAYDLVTKKMYATVLMYRLADDRVIETQDVILATKFPYVPGLLTFREAPALLKAFAKLKATPDVVMIDGQGLAHPRRIGLASHIGLWLDLPTIGCAKSRLIGTFKEPRKGSGSMSPLMDKDEQVGFVVRTRHGVNPLFISVGHKIDLASAVRVVLAAGRGYRVPEPTRLADIRVDELRRNADCGNGR